MGRDPLLRRRHLQSATPPPAYHEPLRRRAVAARQRWSGTSPAAKPGRCRTSSTSSPRRSASVHIPYSAGRRQAADGTAREGPEPRPAPVLPDHLLEEILVRVDDPLDLAHARTACKAFGRLTADPNFLRRYRSLHPPMLLGFIGQRPTHRFLPAEWPHPHPNTPAARAFARVADFSFHDRLPPSAERRGWERYDVRDGRVLVMSYYFEGVLVSPKLALCDPLAREYTLLPPIPDDLLASVVAQAQDDCYDFLYAFFDRSGAGNEDGQFRVMCLMHCFSMVVVFVYSSGSDSWTHGTSVSWAALGFNRQLGDGGPRMCPWLSYAHGCMYWSVSHRLVKLDINSMEFTTVRLPSDHEDRDIIVVEASEGRIGMFSLIVGSKNPLRYSIWQNQSVNAGEQPLENTIPLPRGYEYYFDGGAQGYVFLTGQCVGRHMVKSTYFSLEIKSMEVKRVCSPIVSYDHTIIPYFGFPPSLSP